MEQVLLIGPTVANDEALVRLLEREGRQVSRAAEIPAGLALARTAEPAIVIVDEQLGDHRGLALLRQVRAELPSCEVILISDTHEVEVALEVLRAGALDYLQRPIDQELLRVALGRARERRPRRASVEPPVILVMEDYEPTLRQLTRVLEKEGYRVHAAANGEDGMLLFERNRVDLILADLSMPRKDGLTVLCEVKALEPDVEVIVVTGGGNENAVVDALRQGATNFLKKPVDIEQMLLAIQKALDFQTIRRSLAYRNRDTQIMQELVVRLTRELELVVETPTRISSRTVDFAHQLVDFLPVGIVVSDGHGDIQFANRHVVDRLGHQPSKLAADWLRRLGVTNVTDQQLEAAFVRTMGLRAGSIETLFLSQWAFLVMTPLKLVRPDGTDRFVAVAIRGERGSSLSPPSVPA
jgi:DNA-binding NtrC family response regulator